MQSMIRDHLRTNIVGYLALFVALSSGAYAAATIGPGDIKNKAVRSKHIKPKAVKKKQVDASQVQLRIGKSCSAGEAIRAISRRGGVICEVDDQGGSPGGQAGGPPSGPAGGSLAGTYPNPTLAPNSVGTSQIADDAVNAAKVPDGSLTGSEVADDSLGGGDIVESSLGEVPSALLGGFGRTGAMSSCNPDSATFLTCASVNVNLPAATRVLVIGRIEASTGENSNGNCALATAPGGTVPNTTISKGLNANTGDDIPLVGITGVLPAGATLFALDCNETFGNITYNEGTVTAVAISPN